MHDFQVLFDHGERSELLDPAMAMYGKLGFPAPPEERPWIYSNFVQTLDGILSLGGDEAGGADISELPEDRWLMDIARGAENETPASAWPGIPDHGSRNAAVEGKAAS
jgi:hypothetical protein